MRWTQWIFCKLYERGLAYLAEVPVNWCPALGTVLANEEVIDGKSERGGHPVIRVPMRQWMLRITAYADRLIDDLEEVDWPEAIKKMQRDWIGRSEGARIRVRAAVAGRRRASRSSRPARTRCSARPTSCSRPSTRSSTRLTTPARRAEVLAYVESTARRSERARQAEAEAKTGVATGAFARHPVTGREIPIWIADYVLASYGTGAIMAVPAHDTRDYEFATAFGLPIVEVVAGGDVRSAAFTGEGVAVNSGFLDGLATEAAKQRMAEWLEANGRARRR